MTLLESMPKEFLQQECVKVHMVSCHTVHEDETSKDNVEDVSDVNSISSDNEE